MKKIRYLIYLRDVLVLTLTAFGGAQAHFTLFQNILVTKRGYITEEELIELNSFCQILPGPASTQTLIAVSFKIGGPSLAFLALLVWILPACVIMTLAAFAMDYFTDISFTRFIQPMTIGLVYFAAWRISKMVVITKTSTIIFFLSALFCFLVPNPAIFPIVLLLGGIGTTFRYKKQKVDETPKPWNIEWGNLILYGGVFITAALIGQFTHLLPFRLFENFFRNGSLIFGGGDALIAYFYKEFVDFKEYLTDQEFLAGYAFLRTLPGPVFSFSSYIGALSMREWGNWGMILGGAIGMAGIFLPGTLLMFFLIRFWEKLKNNRVVKASLEGINAASAGVVMSTALVLSEPLLNIGWNAALQFVIIGITFGLMAFTKVKAPYIIIAGLIAGILI